MSKRILIPTDFSANAFNAIAYAMGLLQDRLCTFYIYHTYYLTASTQGNPLFPTPEASEYRSAREGVNSEMESVKDRITALSNPQKHILNFDFEYGFLLDLLQQKAQKENIDLIVMGTRGVTNDREVAYGRNAIDVMEKLRQCPVMAIPSNVDYKELSEIVFPTDFRAKWDRKELDMLLQIAQTANAPLRFLHLGEERYLDATQKENKTWLEGHFATWEHSHHWLPKGDVAEGTLQFVKHRKSAMIAFVNRKHWFFRNIFSNPLVKALGVHATVPLLALHDN